MSEIEKATFIFLEPIFRKFLIELAGPLSGTEQGDGLLACVKRGQYFDAIVWC